MPLQILVNFIISGIVLMVELLEDFQVFQAILNLHTFGCIIIILLVGLLQTLQQILKFTTSNYQIINLVDQFQHIETFLNYIICSFRTITLLVLVNLKIFSLRYLYVHNNSIQERFNLSECPRLYYLIMFNNNFTSYKWFIQRVI